MLFKNFGISNFEVSKSLNILKLRKIYGKGLNEILLEIRVLDIHKRTVKMFTLKTILSINSEKEYKNSHFERFSPPCSRLPKLLNSFLVKTIGTYRLLKWCIT